MTKTPMSRCSVFVFFVAVLSILVSVVRFFCLSSSPCVRRPVFTCVDLFFRLSSCFCVYRPVSVSVVLFLSLSSCSSVCRPVPLSVILFYCLWSGFLGLRFFAESGRGKFGLVLRCEATHEKVAKDAPRLGAFGKKIWQLF